MLLLSVLTLEVTPGSGVSVVLTDPLFPPRPDRGNWTPTCANTGAHAKNSRVDHRFLWSAQAAQQPTSNFCLMISSLPELFAKPADTQAHQHDGEDQQYQKIWPEFSQAALFHQDTARDQPEMPQRIQPGDRL